jgi:hypothetical protein
MRRALASMLAVSETVPWMPSRVGSLAIPLYHEHFLIGQSNATCLNDSLSRLKDAGIHDGREGAVGPDPHVGRVDDALVLQLEGDAVVNVVPNVFLVGQHLVHCAAGPRTAEIGQPSFVVQDGRNFALRPTFLDEQPGYCAERCPTSAGYHPQKDRGEPRHSINS